MSVAISKGRLDANLTKDQGECVDSKGKDLLIKGVAGSGKTLVLLKKAIKLKQEAIKNNKYIRIAFFTYAKTLTKYSKDLIDEIERDDEYKDMITISTFHSYASKMVWSINRGSFKNIDIGKTNKEKKQTILDECMKSQSKIYPKHRLFKLDMDFWTDEIAWIKGKRIKSRDEYLNASRTGRGSGVRLNKKDREVVYSFFEEYNSKLTKNRFIEYDDMSNIVLDKIELIQDKDKFDYVLVDEAQDLSCSQLLLLKNISKESIIIAADHAQKIYKNSFSWSELGINVRGNASKTLNKSFRSTKEIMELSHSLLRHNKSHNGKDTEYTSFILPEKVGRKPRVIKCNSWEEESITLVGLIETFLEKGDPTIGIPYRTWKERKMIKKVLDKEGISFELVDAEDNWSLLEPGVKLVTMHSAKGLEFDIVIMPMVNQGIIPKEEDSQEDLEDFLESERSLLYVAMTRAKNNLFILTSNPSQFIDEMDSNLYDLIEQ